MKNMIEFLKEKGLATLLLSVIFTSSSLFWTNNIVYDRKDLGAIEVGWPISFVVQNHAQLDPPEYWFPHKMGFGLPQEYSTSLNFPRFSFSVVFNFLIIFSIVFVIFKFNQRLLFLRKIISVKYIVGAIGATLFIFISFFIYMYFTRPQINLVRSSRAVLNPALATRLSEHSSPQRVAGYFASNGINMEILPPDVLFPPSLYIDRTYEVLHRKLSTG